MLRVLLFTSNPALAQLAGPLRQPGLFAHHSSEDWWKLHHRLRRTQSSRSPRTWAAPDSKLGWVTASSIAPGTYAHRMERWEHVFAGRRPVLLFGDSFARCMGERGECFEGLMQRSGLGRRFVLVNYGTKGYGFDQTCLLAQAAVGRWLAHDPIVILSVFVDDDLKRTELRLRDWPKPYYRVRAPDRLELVPPDGTDIDAYLEHHPLRRLSYTLAFLVNGSGLLSPDLTYRLAGQPTRDEIVRQRIPLLIRETCSALDAHDLDYFFLIFNGTNSLPFDSPWTWRESVLLSSFEAHDKPFVITREAFDADRERTGRDITAYFGPNQHYNELGNRVAFASLAQGILALDER